MKKFNTVVDIVLQDRLCWQKTNMISDQFTDLCNINLPLAKFVSQISFLIVIIENVISVQDVGCLW